LWGTGIALKVIDYINLPLSTSEWLLSIDLLSYTWPFIGLFILGSLSWVAIESLTGTTNLSGTDSITSGIEKPEIKDKTRSRPVTGRRCPACLERGDTVWVIPGKCCPVCGTPVS